MNSQDRGAAIDKIAAMRVRTMLDWSRRRGEVTTDELIRGIIARRMWVHWGYRRLVECLTEELGLDRDRAADITVKAIKEGYEDGQLYGIDDQQSRGSTGLRS